MNKISITSFKLIRELEEISAASGIVYYNGIYYVIGDDRLHLYMFKSDKTMSKTPIFNTNKYPSEPVVKKLKPDLESLFIISDQNKLVAVPSGSKKERTTGSLIDLTHPFNYENIDFKPLFKSLRKQINIDKEDFNIEGSGLICPNTWFILNRGNGPKRRNLIIILEGDAINKSELITYYPVKLPVINDIFSSFTDGFYLNGRLFFIAAAEETDSTYLDGKVAGSLIGVYGFAEQKILDYKILPEKIKFEGISCSKITDKEITFALCSDPDEAKSPALIYELKISNFYT
jgi:hypothetical protein